MITSLIQNSISKPRLKSLALGASFGVFALAGFTGCVSSKPADNSIPLLAGGRPLSEVATLTTMRSGTELVQVDGVARHNVLQIQLSPGRHAVTYRPFTTTLQYTEDMRYGFLPSPRIAEQRNYGSMRSATFQAQAGRVYRPMAQSDAVEDVTHLVRKSNP